MALEMYPIRRHSSFCKVHVVPASACIYQPSSQFLQSPNMIGQACSHARSDPQRFVDAGEIVVYGIRLASLRLLHLFNEWRDDIEQVADNRVVGDFEDGRL